MPENYDRDMVPLIFEPFAADLAQQAASFSPSAVLETAAGTWVVTRALASANDVIRFVHSTSFAHRDNGPWDNGYRTLE